MMACLLMNAEQIFNTKELINRLYETSKRIISLQDNKSLYLIVLQFVVILLEIFLIQIEQLL